MSFVSLKCKNCGSKLEYNEDAKMVTCTHCASTFLLADLLDERDLTFIKINKPIDAEKSMEISSLLKQADTFIIQAKYTQAEECYKKVVELDDKNSKAYFGIVKTKTSNLNKIPSSNDYKEYAKLALKFADSDDYELIKSSMEKLAVLEKEKSNQKKQAEETEKQKKVQEQNKRINEKFFSKLAYLMVFFVTAVVLVCVALTGSGKTSNPEAKTKTYEITNAIDFTNYLSSKDNYNASYVIKNDLDFKNINWSPIGNKENPFCGKIYGNNHTFSNLKIKIPNGEGDEYAGFFGYIKNAEIFKLKFSNLNILDTREIDYTTTFNIGFVCGCAENSNIKGCEVLSDCKITINHSNQSLLSVGGLVGHAKSTNIIESSSKAGLSLTVGSVLATYSSNNTPNYFIGGLVGVFEDSNMSNSSSSSAITCTLSSTTEYEISSYVGGLVGYKKHSTNTSLFIKNNYFNGTIKSSTDSTNKKQHIAGIVAYGASENILKNNLTLALSNSFELNGSPADITTFYDYYETSTACRYYDSSETFYSDINKIFATDENQYIS